MKVIVGLGNPGDKYKNNRHNVGHMFVDFLRQKNFGIKTVKTDVFMNKSGEFVKKILRKENLDVGNLFIAHDDLDIPLGKFKIQKGEGPRLHNGLKSIEENLKANDFWRIRIGVDTRNPDEWIDGETFVLSDFSNDERRSLEEVFVKILSRLDAKTA